MKTKSLFKSLVTLAFSVMFSFIHAASGAPANDNFADSTHLEGTNVSVTVDFVGATIEPGETRPVTGTDGAIVADKSVWYSWVAPVTGRVYFTTTPFSISRLILVHTGHSLATLRRVPLVIYASNNTFLAQEGTVYYFQIGLYSPNRNTSATFNLELRPEVPADNDYFASAIPLGGNPWYTGGPMPPLHWLLGAGTELGEPAHIGTTPAKSLWWKLQAPYFGQLNMDASISTASNVVISVYQGSTLETLSLLGNFTNFGSLSVVAGEDYYVAAATPTNAVGDVFLTGSCTSERAFHPVPGNVLLNPSFEEGVLFDHWSVSGGYGGYVHEPYKGGADGASWPVLGQGTKIWQEFTTVPGHSYRIRFMWGFGGDLSKAGGARSFRLLWDSNEIAIAQIPATEPSWHCPTFFVVASNTISRLTIENLGYNTDVDGCSIVDVTAAPAIVTQPRSSATLVGGSAAFIVGVTGSEPLACQWLFNGVGLSGATNRVLGLQSVSTNQAGSYSVIVSNAFGSVTSSIANLIVEAPDAPVIVWQPHSESVAAGAFVNLSAVAAGTPPLSYQWFFNDQIMTGFTNRFLTFDQIQLTNAGTYKILVQNAAGSVLSLPATIQVSGTNQGGATIDFRNRFTWGSSNAPVFDIDDFTLLNGSNYVAQLYAGQSLAELRPVGQPTPFYNGYSAGYFVPQLLTLPNIAPGSNVVVQVRAWDQKMGLSYEEARALGGKYGKSEVLSLTTSPSPNTPARLNGLQSFSLQAGLPYFCAGVIRMVERQPGNVVVWAVDGEPKSRYVVEKAVKDFNWEPFLVLTNVTGTVTFTDSANSGANVVIFRARILD